MIRSYHVAIIWKDVNLIIIMAVIRSVVRGGAQALRKSMNIFLHTSVLLFVGLNVLEGQLLCIMCIYLHVCIYCATGDMSLLRVAFVTRDYDEFRAYGRQCYQRFLDTPVQRSDSCRAQSPSAVTLYTSDHGMPLLSNQTDWSELTVVQCAIFLALCGAT